MQTVQMEKQETVCLSFVYKLSWYRQVNASIQGGKIKEWTVAFPLLAILPNT